MSDDGYIGATDVAVIEEAIAKITTAAAEQRERFERALLSNWVEEDISGLSAEDVSRLYDEIYQRKCEGDYDTPFMERLSDLDSEDYEELDAQEGIETGIDIALNVLRGMILELSTS